MKKPKKKNEGHPDPFDPAMLDAALNCEDDGEACETKAEKQKPLGTAKAVETMFRNAVRSEMDLIALAATKANIMISLNGLIISALMISGAFIFASSVVFLFPAGVFMFTAAASIIFALLAASPERAHHVLAIRRWYHARKAGLAGWRDLPRYIRLGNKEDEGQLNLLIYEDRMMLSRDDYWERMQTLLRDRDDIYKQMSDQLYWLGDMANRKFKLLNVSYTIFRWGLVASVLTFVGVKLVFGLFPGLNSESTARLRNLGISEFSDIYEPSGVQQLPDGRILVVEDEASRALSLMRIGPDGTLIEDPAGDMRLTRSLGRRLNDLEGLSIDERGFIYAITSHSSNERGQRRPDREQLIRFRIEGNHLGNILTVSNLRDALSNDVALSRAIEAAAGEPADFEELNIEGLAFYREAQQLMLGLRGPMAGGMSIIVPITNPGDMFERGAAPQFAAPILLDLAGGGIRALSYDPVLMAFMIVNEIRGEDGKKHSQIWTWSGQPNDAPAQILLPDIINLNNVESIDSITIDGESRLLLMSDEGDPTKNRPAKYMMLDYSQLGRP
ncbi:MAG: DUF3616 domain-containing protein [Paracoccus sp. (in: a-proteobacteria)]|nr:DUF3616 domain-containing protein [Paracoccus sp. (in: a-proteobacteria)]